MFALPTLLSCLRGLIGFDAGYAAATTLDADLTQSESGRWVNASLQPLLTYENILAVAEHFERVNVRGWSATVTYRAGEVVKSGTEVYRSLQNANTGHAVTDGAWWAKTTLLSAYLRRVYEGSCTKLLSRLFTEKKVGEAIKTLLGVGHLYEGAGNISGRITPQGRVVGYKIRLHHPDTQLVLSYIGLQLSAPQNPLSIYLYHSSQELPVQTWTLNHTKQVSFQWHQIIQEVLSYLSEEVNAGGAYYVCYYEGELTGEAIKKDISFSGHYNCSSCSEATVNARLYQKWSRLVAVQPFYVPAAYVDAAGHKLWDESQEIYVEDTTWGLNFQFHVLCDVSRVLCETRALLTDALAQQLTVDLLHDMAFSLRDNQQKQKIALLATAALDPAEGSRLSELARLDRAVGALSFDFSNLSQICLPCNNQQRSRIKSIWG